MSRRSSNDITGIEVIFFREKTALLAPLTRFEFDIVAVIDSQRIIYLPRSVLETDKLITQIT